MVSTSKPYMENIANQDLSQLAAEVKADPRAFGRLYDLLVQPVYRYLYRRTGSTSDAEDLTSQTFTTAFEALQRYRHRDGVHFAAWVFTIARHKLADHYRRSKRWPPPEPQIEPSVSPDTLGRLVRDEELEGLQALIRELSEEERDLIYLRYVAELTYADMAEVLGKKEDAVKKSVYRLLARLKSRME
ncbi:MAG: hypothetical protein PWQ55_1240 [Chloroflexota bacterium]|nr:hypothetical protein [Chloroflexota bacterium]